MSRLISSEPLLVRFGGHSRAEILRMLSSAGVRTNAHADIMLKNSMFDHPAESALRVLDQSVGDLGLYDGGTLSEVFAAAFSQGLGLVPLVASPYLRIAIEDQEQAPDSILSGCRVPSESVTIASPLPSADEEYPKGFYLRIVDGESWLRGYQCSDDYVFGPEARFMFASAVG